MELFFLRHGRAEEVKPGQTDADRVLSTEGGHEVEEVAAGLPLLGLMPDVIIASPLIRARQTAQIVATALSGDAPIEDERLSPGCTLQAVQHIVADHPDAARLLFVGHEPDLSRIVSELIGGGSIKLRQSGIARVDAEAVEAGRGTLMWLLNPEQILRLSRGSR